MKRWTTMMITLGLLVFWVSPSFLWAEDLASVNGQVITSEELEAKLQSLNPQMRVHYMSSAGKAEFLDELIVREVVLQEGIRLGLDKDKETLTRLEEAKRGILINRMFEKIMDEKLGDEQVKKYYAGHQKEFKQVKASHILVDKEQEAKEIYKQLKGGADFAELAKKHSKDPSSRDQGGDLGYFTRGQMVKPFEDMAFSLKVNKVSEPVQTSFGYHIIKVVDIKDPKKFEDLSSEDLNTVRRQMFNDEIERLKKSAKIVIHTDRIK